MRGKLLPALAPPRSRRITPACAGKTSFCCTASLSAADHPRVCGENQSGLWFYGPERGSPPRVRGKQTDSSMDCASIRITPACAGKTRRRASRFSFSADHPRVCGENSLSASPASICDGSPPRVRGKLVKQIGYTVTVRITPACAGKTKVYTRYKYQQMDHPRVCGENNCSLSKCKWRGGSPPRVRGKPSCSSFSDNAIRITPACAGKTQFRVWRLSPGSDHPRVCGENSTPLTHSSTSCGSPPRVRGKRPCAPSPTRCPRITPACAGKTSA